MGAAFSATVTSAAWREEVERWAAGTLAERGVRLTGAPDQTRVRPWSTQLVVPTDHGPFWVKACCRASAFEPALHRRLAELLPHAVDAPVATDARRGWMLTADRGATLGDTRTPTSQDWQDVLALWSRVQHDVRAHREDLLATGLPDCSPTTVPARFDTVLHALTGLGDDHPARLDDATAGRLVGARGAVEGAAATLAEAAPAGALQHGDLHPWNVFAVGGGLRVFDLGDAQWAHPLESLEVPRAVVEDSGLAWPPVEDAYRTAHEASAGAEERDQWRRLRAASGVTHAVNRAWSWWRLLAEATDAEWDEWGEAPGRHLSRVVELTAPGA